MLPQHPLPPSAHGGKRTPAPRLCSHSNSPRERQTSLDAHPTPQRTAHSPRTQTHQCTLICARTLLRAGTGCFGCQRSSREFPPTSLVNSRCSCREANTRRRITCLCRNQRTPRHRTYQVKHTFHISSCVNVTGPKQADASRMHLVRLPSKAKTSFCCTL